jgi:site-specific recombinase XerC
MILIFFNVFAKERNMNKLFAQCNFGKMHSASTLTAEKNIGNVERILQIIEKEFGLTNLDGIKTKHMERVFEVLQEKGLSNSTLASYATAARLIASQIHKENIVPRTNAELGISRAGERLNPVQCNAEKIEEIRQNLYAQGQHFGLAHDMRAAFGLRAKESLLSSKVTSDAQGRQFLAIEGSKGGRPREIEIRTDEQKAALQQVQTYLRETRQKSLIPAGQNLKQGIQAQKKALERAGAKKGDGTHAHALRHAYAQTRATEVGKQKVANELGHGRADIVAHYVK